MDELNADNVIENFTESITENAASDTAENTSEAVQVDIIPWRVWLAMGTVGRTLVIVALLFALTAVSFSVIIRDVPALEAVSAYITVVFMLWLAMIDTKHFVLPNKILLAWLLCRTVFVVLGFLIVSSVDIMVDSVIGAVVIGLFFLVTHYLSKRSLGGGDVKLSFVLGFSLTITMIFTAVFYGLILCAIFALTGLAAKKLTRKTMIPLGPFLFAGTITAYILQIQWWL
jgi:prepilin signal peptidase PulO-like enzyme (type II secretory pathway)